MKKLLFSLFIFLSAFDAFSQVTDIDSFYLPGSVWRYKSHLQWNAGGGGCEDTYWSYKIERDSTINGTNYHLISGQDIGKRNCGSPINFVNIDYGIFGGIRTDARKVYLLLFDTVSTVGGVHPFVVSGWRDVIKDNYSAGNEYLLYDFDLDVNVTLTWMPGYYVDHIDSITISNGQQAKLYTFLTQGGGNAWIEGMGSVCNLLASKYGVGSNNLICYNGAMGSYFSDFSDCGAVGAGVNEQISSIKQLAIYPNPLNGDMLQIKAHKGISMICITNISGKVCEQHILSSAQANINTSLSIGIYFIKVLYKDGSTETQKLVKY